MNTNSMEQSENRIANPEGDLPIVFGRHLSFRAAPVPVPIYRLRHVSDIFLNARSVLPDIRPITIDCARLYARQRTDSSYWRDSGWEKRDDFLIGLYRARNRNYFGSIWIRDSRVDPLKFFIYDPPYGLLGGPHGACFRNHGRVGGRDKYFVHFSERPDDIDSGIIQIERNLAEVS